MREKGEREGGKCRPTLPETATMFDNVLKVIDIEPGKQTDVINHNESTLKIPLLSSASTSEKQMCMTICEATCLLHWPCFFLLAYLFFRVQILDNWFGCTEC